MKKFFKLITPFALVLLTAVIFFIPISAQNIAGDIDGNGTVSDSDAEYLLKYLSDWNITVVGGALDTNGDGNLNIRDAAQILLYLQYGDEVELHYTGICYHKGAIIEKKVPSCEAIGTIEHWQCRGCGNLFADKECTITLEENDLTIPAKGHIEDIDPAVEPGYKTVGYTEGKHCSVCNKVLAESKVIPPTAFSDPEKYHNDYGYNSLSSLANGAQMQAFYNALDEAAAKFHTDCSINAVDNTVASINFVDFGITLDEAIAIWTTYKNDHPLYYWISPSISFSDSTLSLLTTDDYAKGSDRASYNDLIYLGVMDYIALIGDEISSYNIALAFHDAIIIEIDYAYESDGYTPEDEIWAHNVLGVFEKKSGVCESYARTFQLLLNYCEIDNLIVTGISYDQDHAWNMAKMDDGNWYWFDLTWDDNPIWMWGIAYNYFCVNDTQDVSWSDGGWGSTGASFLQNHVCNSSNLGIKYLYPLPNRASEIFDSESPILRDTFTIDGATYAVVGYNTVQLVEYSLPGDLIIPESVIYCGKYYTVISVGVMDANGRLNEGTISYCEITSVTLPKTVKFIWDKAFRISSIKEFEVDNANPCFASKDGVLFTKSLYTMIQYPLNAEYTEYSIPDNTAYVTYYAFGVFDYSPYLSALNIGKDVRSVYTVNWGYGYPDPNVCVPGMALKETIYMGCGGFWGSIKCFLTGSKTVRIEKNNTYYWSDGYGIYDSQKIKLMYLSNDPSVTSYNIPNSVKSIEEFALSECNTLKNINISEGVTRIEAYTFYNSINLEHITLSPNCTFIGNFAFGFCQSLTSINIPDSTTKISISAFYGCENLTQITIGKSCTYIESNAFAQCNALTDVYYAGSEEEWAAINIAAGNEYLTNATIHFNYVAE